MKLIGIVEPTKYQLTENSQDENQNGEYLGGGIVLLSRHEMASIKMLQEACEGLKSNYLRMEWEKPENAMMDDLFMLVYRFAEAKFAINDFKGAIEGLENVLGGNKDEL